MRERVEQLRNTVCFKCLAAPKGPKNRQIDRQADRQIESNREREGEIDKETQREGDKEIHRERERQASTTFRSISRFALPSMHHNNSPLL